jgi:CheY-like chemotaxis protein
MSTRILLVDDDSDDREFFCEALEGIPFETFCYTAPDGRKALSQMDKKEIDIPDLIFIDINMPVMSGWKCLSLLKEREEYKNIPVIMYSTSSYAEDIEKARRAGALCFLSKPNDIKELRKNLEIIVAHYINGSPLSFKPGLH